jgi:NAD(P)-dependent dehydrogenase (short-subunit alcohol dehydrogenase family)
MSKVALITGSSGGIGSVLVRKYLDDGYFVTGLDRNSSENPVLDGYTEIEVSLLMFSKDPLCRERVLQ